VWRLQVERWEPAGPKSSWEGTVQRRDDGLRLETHEGQELLLPDPPQELPDGAWVSVTSSLAIDASECLEWDTIVVLPEATGAVVNTQQLGTVQAVFVSEPTSRPTATSIVTPSLTVTSSSAPIPVAVPPRLLMTGTSMSPGSPPDWWSYRPGDQATVQGLFSVYGYRLPDGGVAVWASLSIQDPQGETTLPLASNSLEDLVTLDQLHGRGRGQILSNEQASERQEEASWGLFDQVLWVEQVE
jgi:hypothetical protein